LRRAGGSWLKIGSRILASWLVAIGLLLGGSKFVVQQRSNGRRPRRHCSCSAGVDRSGSRRWTPTFTRPREWGDQSQQP